MLPEIPWRIKVLQGRQDAGNGWNGHMSAIFSVSKNKEKPPVIFRLHSHIGVDYEGLTFWRRDKAEQAIMESVFTSCFPSGPRADVRRGEEFMVIPP